MENKQTAVEWLRDQYINCPENFLLSEDFEKAFEMEKEQIIAAAKWLPKPFELMEFLPELAEQYYKKTYNK